MGSASSGPLFVYLPREKRTLALDLTRLTATEVRWNHWSPSNAYGPLHMRASPDGTLLLGWAGGWAGLDMAVFDSGAQVGAYDKFEFSVGIFALPSADGRRVFTPWAIVERDLTAKKVAGLVGRAYLVPAHGPGDFLALHPDGNRGLPSCPYGKKAPANLPGVSQLAFYTDDAHLLVNVYPGGVPVQIAAQARPVHGRGCQAILQADQLGPATEPATPPDATALSCTWENWE